jgi:hypothetical protein
MNTLLLDIDLWDLCKDSGGNIAMATPPYALAQDVASAIKTFLGEVWFDITLGIAYLSQILGKTPPLTLFQQYMVDAALTVPGVVKATCVISSFEGRTVTGQVQFTDTSGKTQIVSF